MTSTGHSPLSGGSEKMARLIEDVQFYYSSNRYSMVQKCMTLIVDHHLVVGVVSNVSVNCSHLATVYPGASGTCTPFTRNYVLLWTIIASVSLTVYILHYIPSQEYLHTSFCRHHHWPSFHIWSIPTPTRITRRLTNRLESWAFTLVLLFNFYTTSQKV